MNKCLSTLSLILIFSAGLLAHGDKTLLSFSGFILEEEQGQAIKGATISIEKNGRVIHTTKSNGKGYFSLKLEGPIARMDQLVLRVEKPGFQSQVSAPLTI
ncbi:MAG: carboxypeptidase-like regulatory domain-containing protein [Owenweeksia sp.]|nr:carboxypeptidase-like regulatory domain-containing protein [Owenweeksia sp.]